MTVVAGAIWLIRFMAAIPRGTAISVLWTPDSWKISGRKVGQLLVCMFTGIIVVLTLWVVN